MPAAAVASALSVRKVLQSLGDWLIAALLSMASLLAVGLLTAAPLGAAMIDTSLTGAFIAAAFGGALAGLFARAPAEITIPTPSTTVIYAALGADLVHRSAAGANVWEIWAAMSLAVVLTGVMLLLAGSLRLAGFIKFMPAPVSAGFVTGIGLLVIRSQLAPILGVPAGQSSLVSMLSQVQPAAVAVAMTTILTLVLVPRFKRLGQPIVVAVIAGVAAHYALAPFVLPEMSGATLPELHPQSTAVQTAHALWDVLSPRWILSTLPQVLPYAALLALQAIMNAAVTAVTVGSIVGRQSNVNRTLVTQGVANIVCGGVGALPVSTSAAQSVPAARMKGDPRYVALGSAIMLSILVLAAGKWLTLIPVAVLAAVLLMAGVAMVNQSTIKLIRAAWVSRSRDAGALGTTIIAIIVAAAMFFGSVPFALLVGALLAMLLLAIELSAATRFSAELATPLGSRRVWTGPQASWLREHRARIAVFRPQGTLFFGTADQFSQRLAGMSPETRFCVIDLSRVTTVDATACQIIAARARALAASGIVPLLAGVAADSPRGRNLVALGLSSPDRATAWFIDLDHALEHAEGALLREAWPELDRPQGLDLGETPLGAGIGDDDLRELKAALHTVDVPSGLLFRRGDPGSAMYLIESGAVEIRISDEAHGPHIRLAAYGPGSVFGEMSLLMSQQRTADAVCVTATRLLELDRERLDALEKTSPRLYGALMRNLNVHLAKRLELTTELVKAFR